METPWKFSLTALEKIGVYSVTKTKKIVTFAIIYAALMMLNEISLLLQFSNFHSDVSKFSANLEAVGGNTQLLGKLFVCVYYQDKLNDLILGSNKFWKTDLCNEAIKSQLDNISNNAQRLQKLFMICIVFCIFMMILSGLSTHRALPLGVWTLNKYELLYHISLVTQVIMLPFLGVFVAAFDCIFLIFCAETIIQLKILQYCLTNLEALGTSPNCKLEGKTYYASLKTCIKQHVFLLRYLEKLKDFYSPVLLIVFATDSPIICTQIYALMDGGNPVFLIRHSVETLVQLVQLGFYCITSDYSTSEALEVSNAIYDSEWYLQDNYLIRRSIPLIIQNSQKITTFKAGGLFNINSRTILTVLRVSWSACTLMRALKK